MQLRALEKEEYDLIRSSIQDGIQLRKTLRIEQTAVPAGLCL